MPPAIASFIAVLYRARHGVTRLSNETTSGSPLVPASSVASSNHPMHDASPIAMLPAINSPGIHTDAGCIGLSRGQRGSGQSRGISYPLAQLLIRSCRKFLSSPRLLSSPTI